MRIRPLPIALAAPAALAGVLAIQIAIVTNREYLPSDTGYTVAATVEPRGGASTSPALRIVVLGDSTTAGVGSPTAAESLPIQLAARVADAEQRPVHVTGLGVSGARTADLTDEQLPLVKAEDPDVIVIVIGSNDVTHVTAPRRLGDQTRRMLDTARAQGVPVVLGGIPLFDVVAFPQPLRWFVARWSSVGRAVQERAARDADGVTYVPIAREASPRFAGVPNAMSSDGFHPAPVGYGFWADALAAGVSRALQ